MTLFPKWHTPEAVAERLIAGLENGELVLDADTDAGFPEPAVLAEYERVTPGFANRLLEVIEKNGEHRRKMEALRLEAASAFARRGQFACLAVAVAAVVAGSLAASSGLQWVGALIGIGGALALAAVFAFSPPRAV